MNHNYFFIDCLIDGKVKVINTQHWGEVTRNKNLKGIFILFKYSFGNDELLTETSH